MANITRRSLLALPALAPFAGGVLTDAFGQEANKTAPDEKAVKRWLAARERQRRRYFPDVVLTTHEGKKVRLYEDLIKDKTVVLTMMYAECDGVCPGITANLVKAQRLFGDKVGRDIFFYSFTLKPEQDDVAALKHYAEMHRVKPGWLFLTGDPADMELLRVKLGFTYPDPKIDKDDSQHIGNVRYGNEPNMYWGACPGLSDPEWIVKSISWVMPRQEKQAKT